MLRRERERMSQRLEATVAGLCELRILRERQETLVASELTLGPARSPDSSRDMDLRGATERPLGEALELLRDQLRSLRRRDASLYLQLKSLGDRLGEMGLGGAAQVLNQQREEAMFNLGEERPGRVTQAPRGGGSGAADRRSSRRRPSSGFSEWSGGADRRVGSESDESEGSDEQVATPGGWDHSDPASPVSPAARRFARDMPSLDGAGLYRYPSALHAVAIQSPALLLLRDAAADDYARCGEFADSGEFAESGESGESGAADEPGEPDTPGASRKSGDFASLGAIGAFAFATPAEPARSGDASGISSRPSGRGEAGATGDGAECLRPACPAPAGKPDDYIARLLERRRWRQAAAAVVAVTKASRLTSSEVTASLSSSSSSSSSGRGSSVPSLPPAGAAGDESEATLRMSLRSPPPPPPPAPAALLPPPALPAASSSPSSLSPSSLNDSVTPPPPPAVPPSSSSAPRATRLVASVPPMKHSIVRGVSHFLTGGRLHAGKRAATKPQPLQLQPSRRQQQQQQQQQPPPETASKAAVRRCKSASLDRVAEWRPPDAAAAPAPFKRATTFGAPGRGRAGNDGGGAAARPLNSGSSRSIWDFFAAERRKMAAAAAAEAERADYAVPPPVHRLCRPGDAGDGGSWAPLAGGGGCGCCCCCEEMTGCGCPGSCDGDDDDDNDDDDEGGFAPVDRCYRTAAGFHDNRFGDGGAPLGDSGGFRGDALRFDDGGGGGFRGDGFRGNGFRGEAFRADGFHGHSFHGFAKLPRGGDGGGGVGVARAGLRGNQMYMGSASFLGDGFLGDGCRGGGGDAWRHGDARLLPQGKASAGFEPAWGRPGVGVVGALGDGAWWGPVPGGVVGGRASGPQVSVAHVVPVGPLGPDGPAARRRVLLRCHSVEPGLTTTV